MATKKGFDETSAVVIRFAAIARIIKQVKEDYDDGISAELLISFLEDGFADYFESQDPNNFDRDRFIRACNGDCT